MHEQQKGMYVGMTALLSEWRKIGKEIGPVWSGLHLVLGVAIASRFLHGLMGGETSQ